jgi:hypothetical protein
MDSSRTAVYEFHRRRDTNLNRQLGVVAAAGSLQGSMLLVDGRCEVTRAAVQCPQLDRFSLLDRSTERDRPMTVQEKQTYAHTDIRAPVRCPSYFFSLRRALYVDLRPGKIQVSRLKT